MPIIWTIFAPPMILPMLARGGRDQAMGFLRDAPRETARAFDVMAETLAEYARLCLAAGADGLFYATNVATRALMSAEECRRWQRPWDLRILEAVEQAPFNLLHVCGAGIHVEEFADYPVTAWSFATVPGNPTLAEVRRAHRPRGGGRAPGQARDRGDDRGRARRAGARGHARGRPRAPARARLLDQPGHAGTAAPRGRRGGTAQRIILTAGRPRSAVVASPPH